jgi:hypothetical protein
MNALKPTGLLRVLNRTHHQPYNRIPLAALQRRLYATDPIPPSPHPPSSPPNPNDKPPSRVAAFYKTFSYPVLKCFLGALFTYQLAYYLWFKLEVVEEKALKDGEVATLKMELKDAVVKSKEGARGVVEKVEGKVEEGVEVVKKKGWWPW